MLHIKCSWPRPYYCFLYINCSFASHCFNFAHSLHQLLDPSCSDATKSPLKGIRKFTLMDVYSDYLIILLHVWNYDRYLNSLDRC